jgi:hypothetical protein
MKERRMEEGGPESGGMERKVKVGLFLPRDLLENVRSLIQQKYARYGKGLLSYEAEMALRYWLSLHTKAQENPGFDKHELSPKVLQVFEAVKAYLLSNWYIELKPGQQVSRLHLEKAIMAVRGSDGRTVKKWLRVFHQMDLVKPIANASWEIMK